MEQWSDANGAVLHLPQWINVPTLAVGYCYQQEIRIERNDHKVFVCYQKSGDMDDSVGAHSFGWVSYERQRLGEIWMKNFEEWSSGILKESHIESHVSNKILTWPNPRLF
ncbi:hypothetical protein F8M41_018008 [Gigaspora margarita]|uniref:Uncharacterized protein n=1 Tax=Gigaspora margarita TaxID=4874 RepID=A0A8H4AM67_GIGMA|nr:hypothetical protein F8M41_018008 [Gigaspora margarita]